MSNETNAEIDTLKKELRIRIDKMETADIYSLAQSLNIEWRSWAGGPMNVMCSLQNNPKLISVSQAIQCSSCARYFCKDHNLIHCPHCNHKL